jgi:hypothetical protein
MIHLGVKARQPIREAWPMERIVCEQSIDLWNTLDRSTNQAYSSALNSYVTFLRPPSSCARPNGRHVITLCRFHVCPYKSPFGRQLFIWNLEPSGRILSSCQSQLLLPPCFTHPQRSKALLLHSNLVWQYLLGWPAKHLNLQCMSIPVHLRCHPTISASLMLRTHLEIIALVLPMPSPVPFNPTGAYIVVTHCWLSWQRYYMYSHRLQYLKACYILSDPKFWYLLSPTYSGFSRS